MQEILQISEEILGEYHYEDNDESDSFEEISKMIQLYTVLKQQDDFDGIEKKIQLKPISWKETIPEDPEKSSKISEEVTEVLLILKWGGELTHTGI